MQNQPEIVDQSVVPVWQLNGPRRVIASVWTIIVPNSCRVCGVPRSNYCVGPKGKMRDSVHTQRWLDFLDSEGRPVNLPDHLHVVFLGRESPGRLDTPAIYWVQCWCCQLLFPGAEGHPVCLTKKPA